VFAAVRFAASCGVGFEGFGEGTGKGGFDVGEGEEPLGLTEGGAEGLREDAEGSEILLEFGDPYREGLRAGVKGGEVLFELGGAAGELGDLGEEVGA
jgi:hypothetical protein